MTSLALLWRPALPLTAIAALALIGLAAIIFLAIRSRSIGPRRIAMLTVLRVAALAGIVTLLIGPADATTDAAPAYGERYTVLLDLSGSMGVVDATGDVSRLERYRRAWLDDLTAGLMEKLRWVGFGEQTQSLTPAEVRRVSADAAATRISDALDEIITQLPTGGRILVVSDGHDTTAAAPPAALTDRARRRNVRIDALALGRTPDLPPIRLRVTPTRRVVFDGEPVELAVRLTSPALVGASVRAELFRDGRSIELRQKTTDAATAEIRFTDTPPALGSATAQRHYRVEVAVTRDARREALSDDVFVMQSGRRIQVLLIEGRPHWDTRALIAALRAHPRLALTSIQSLGEDRPTLIQRPAEADAPSGDAPDLSGDFLKTTDLVLIGRGVDALLDEAAWAKIADHVRSGGGLWLTRGRPWSGATPDGLGGLLPVEIGGFMARPSAITAANIDAWADSATWTGRLDELPTARGVWSVESASPATQVWLRAGNGEGPAALVFARRGAGRVAVTLVDGLWRWRMLPPDAASGDGVFDDMVRRVVGRLAMGEDFLPGQRYAIRLDTAAPRVGEPVGITLLSRGGFSDTDAPPVLSLRAPDGSRTTLNTTADPADTARRVATYTPDEAGIHTLSAGGGALPDYRFVVSRSDLEMTDTSPRPAFLEALSRQTDGVVFTLDDRDRWVELVNTWSSRASDQRIASAAKQAEPAWPRLWVFFAIVGLLCVEYFARRQGGLT